MYRHLLVPLDATDLSVEVVGNAVGLAQSLGARITFFHAVADTTPVLGDGRGGGVRISAPDDQAHLGLARELLAKAEAAARAFGVPCTSMHAVHDRPAAAIVEAARRTECDLIFMASHGRRRTLGMALASETVGVLMNAGLPVLVAATGDLQPPARAIGVIRDEHRLLAAMLHAATHVLAVARAAGDVPDEYLLRGLLRCLLRFVTLHHPKEERHLFVHLRARTTSIHAELDELERQHVRDRQLVGALMRETNALYATPDRTAKIAAVAALEQSLAHYAAFTWEHLGREEGVILPAARRCLTAADWAEIDAAFAEQRELPGAGCEAEFRELLGRVGAPR